MQELIIKVTKESLIITGFIFVMMMVIEYINVQTSGLWKNYISGNKWKQYGFAAILGAIPGCLGAYTAVALFSHRLFSIGAIVTTMIATSGDEAFVMFAMVPTKAIIISVILIIVGILAGYLTDKFVKNKTITNEFSENDFPLHKHEKCECYNPKAFKNNLIKPSLRRVIISILIVSLIAIISAGLVMDDAPLWIKLTVISTALFSLFVVITVPEHFIKEHIWAHIIKVHLPNIFFWTLGTMLVVNILLHYVNINTYINDNMILVLLFSVLVGIIPQSGPHLVFLTLFTQGTIPLSILIASSFSQDGHGMLPLLAESKKSFAIVKAINIAVALVVGYGLLAFGF